MRDAAVTLLRQCGAAKSEGGLAINIGKHPQSASKHPEIDTAPLRARTENYQGGDGNMALIMGVYKPQVLCRGLFPQDASCKNIIRGMPASTTMHIFGPQSDPMASVNVPHTLGGSGMSHFV